MKRITLNLDLEDNEVLSKEIESMIKSTVEHRYKGYVNSIVDEEIQESIQNRVDQWKRDSWGQGSRIKRAVDDAISKSIKIPELDKEEVFRFLDGKIKDRECLFESTISKCLNEKNLREYITKEVERQLKEVLTSSIVKAIFDK